MTRRDCSILDQMSLKGVKIIVRVPETPRRRRKLMMRKDVAIMLLLVLVAITPTLFAKSTLDRADELYDADLHQQSYDYLKTAVSGANSDQERAGLYWRFSRATLEVGDIEELDGASTADLLNRFLEGEEYADIALELEPDNHEAYYWKSANIGRWAETKGILNSLFKARPMRELLRTALGYYPGHASSFYVLGIMYERVPGFPISFGNANYAVSLARKSIDANHEEIAAGIDDKVKLTHYMELARHLHVRNWNSSKRSREQAKKANQYRSKTDVLEKNFYYEGTQDIPNMSDREEAIEVITWVVSAYESKTELNNSDRADLAEARVDLETWTK